jgi:hypothetical protein
MIDSNSSIHLSILMIQTFVALPVVPHLLLSRIVQVISLPSPNIRSVSTIKPKLHPY